METKEVIKKSWKPFIIANPIYDTVFKRLMENQRIAKFLIGTILEQHFRFYTENDGLYTRFGVAALRIEPFIIPFRAKLSDEDTALECIRKSADTGYNTHATGYKNKLAQHLVRIHTGKKNNSDNS
jgi:hypothetical protein